MKESTEQNLYEYEEEFRNTLATVDEKGKRVWIYPKKPSGHYHRLRILVTTILLSIFFAGPFIQLNGRPFMLFNIFERKFIFFRSGVLAAGFFPTGAYADNPLRFRYSIYGGLWSALVRVGMSANSFYGNGVP
ncbi:MAG: hypothetical protein U5K54_06875 [Cytophagales bacterium]|nr:hypothetical protein [Cytophagales bacterium]